jgi:hypothetical protein
MKKHGMRLVQPVSQLQPLRIGEGKSEESQTWLSSNDDVDGPMSILKKQRTVRLRMCMWLMGQRTIALSHQPLLDCLGRN